MTRAIIFAALLLAACGTPPAPRVDVQTVYVEKPVLCKVPAVSVPDWPTKRLKRDDGIFVKVQAMAAELEMRIAYETKLLAANRACQ